MIQTVFEEKNVLCHVCVQLSVSSANSKSSREPVLLLKQSSL